MSKTKALITASRLDLSMLSTTRYQNNSMILSVASRRNLLSLGKKFNLYLRKKRRKITAETIRDFLEELKFEYAPSTWNLSRQNLKRLLKLQPQINKNYLFRLLVDEIFKDIRPIQIDRQVKEYLSEKEIQKLIRNSPARLGLIIETLFLTGCRISELIGIRLRDIRKSDSGAAITVLGKGNKVRTVYIPNDLLRNIRHTFQSRIYLFENRKGNQLDASNLWKAIRKAGRKVLRKDIHPHLLRHSTASYLLLEKGRSAKYVSRYLGHSTPAVTLDMYVHEQPRAEIVSLFNLSA
jgi:integrase/recombinase XerD